MRVVYRFLVVSALVSLTGCVSVRSSINAEAVPPSFSRVLVVTKMRNAPDRYVQQFARSFPAGYEVCTLALSPLSFGTPEEAIQKQVADCRSEVILTLELIQTGQSGRYSRYSSGRHPNYPYEYNAEMKSVADEQPFWKAIISSDAVNGETVPPNAVLNRLIKDHILKGNLPSTNPISARN